MDCVRVDCVRVGSVRMDFCDSRFLLEWPNENRIENILLEEDRVAH